MDNDIKLMFEKVLLKLDGMDKKISSMDSKIGSIEIKVHSIEERQEEMYLLQRGLEENVKITRAEQDKMMHLVADIHGKVTRLGNEVDEHDLVIKQIIAIK